MPISIERFAKHLPATASRTEQVLRGHLWIETQLNSTITTWCPHPEVLRLDRMSHASKIDLAFAVGGIDADSRTWFRAVNKVRNRLAHDLDGEPTNEEIAELVSSVTGFGGDIFREALELTDRSRSQVRGGDPQDDRGAERNVDGQLRSAILVQLVCLEFRRMHEEWRRAHEVGLFTYRVERTLIRTAGHDLDAALDRDLRARHGIAPEPRPRDSLIPPKGIDIGQALERFARAHPVEEAEGDS